MSRCTNRAAITAAFLQTLCTTQLATNFAAIETTYWPALYAAYNSAHVPSESTADG